MNEALEKLRALAASSYSAHRRAYILEQIYEPLRAAVHASSEDPSAVQAASAEASESVAASASPRHGPVREELRHRETGH